MTKAKCQEPRTKNKKQIELIMKIETKDEMDSCASALALTQGELKTAKAKMEAEVEEVANRHGGAIKELEDRESVLETALEEWARANEETEFSKRKTIATSAGHKLTLKGTPGKVVIRDGFTAATVLSRLKADPELRRLYLRWKPELDKETVQDNWDDDQELLEKIGIGIEKEKKFTFTAREITPGEMEGV